MGNLCETCFPREEPSNYANLVLHGLFVLQGYGWVKFDSVPNASSPFLTFGKSHVSVKGHRLDPAFARLHFADDAFWDS